MPRGRGLPNEARRAGQQLSTSHPHHHLVAGVCSRGAASGSADFNPERMQQPFQHRSIDRASHDSAFTAGAKRELSVDPYGYGEYAAREGSSSVLDGGHSGSNKRKKSANGKRKAQAAPEVECPVGPAEESRLGRSVDEDAWLEAISSDRGSSVCICAELSRLGQTRERDGVPEMKVPVRSLSSNGSSSRHDDTLLLVFRGEVVEAVRLYLQGRIDNHGPSPSAPSPSIFISGLGAMLVANEEQTTSGLHILFQERVCMAQIAPVWPAGKSIKWFEHPDPALGLHTIYPSTEAAARLIALKQSILQRSQPKLESGSEGQPLPRIGQDAEEMDVDLDRQFEEQMRAAELVVAEEESNPSAKPEPMEEDDLLNFDINTPEPLGGREISAAVRTQTASPPPPPPVGALPQRPLPPAPPRPQTETQKPQQALARTISAPNTLLQSAGVAEQLAPFLPASNTGSSITRETNNGIHGAASAGGNPGFAASLHFHRQRTQDRDLPMLTPLSPSEEELANPIVLAGNAYQRFNKIRDSSRSDLIGLVTQSTLPTRATGGTHDYILTLQTIDNSPSLGTNTTHIGMQFFRPDAKDLPPRPQTGDVIVARNFAVRKNEASRGLTLQAKSFLRSNNGKPNCWMMLRLSPNGEPQCWKSSNWPGEPSAAEREYAHRLALWGKLTLSGEAGEDSASRKARMLITLDQTRPQLFFDCVVEVLDVSVGARPFITVTDYTAHPCFDRENDALLHARLGFPPPEDVIPGDGGGRVFHITLFGAQRAATEVLRANKRYHFKNVRAKVSQFDTRMLEGTLGNFESDKRGGLDFLPVQDDEPEVEMLLERKRLYREMLRSSATNPSPPASTAASPTMGNPGLQQPPSAESSAGTPRPVLVAQRLRSGAFTAGLSHTPSSIAQSTATSASSEGTALPTPSRRPLRNVRAQMSQTSPQAESQLAGVDDADKGESHERKPNLLKATSTNASALTSATAGGRLPAFRSTLPGKDFAVATIADLKSKQVKDSTFLVRARVMNVRPPNPIDWVVLRCLKCNRVRTIEDGPVVCPNNACKNEEGTSFVHDWRVGFVIQDDSSKIGQGIIIEGKQEASKLFEGIDPRELRKTSDTVALTKRLQPLLGSLLDLRAGPEVSPNPMVSMTIRKRIIKGHDYVTLGPCQYYVKEQST